MLKHRIIPVLLNSGDGLVKTIKFSDPIYIGDPINTAKLFNDKQSHELIILDIEASKKKLGPNLNLIDEITSQCFMPVSYGGGVRNLLDATSVFRLGIEKIIFENTLFTNFNLLDEVATEFGSQSVIASIVAYRDQFNDFYIYNSTVNRKTNITLESVLRNLKNSLVGEIMFTSFDKEGTLSGFDLELIEYVKKNSSVPLIANGGAGNLNDLASAIKAGADAVAAGSLFVFYGSRKSILVNYPSNYYIQKYLG
jgi:cyclase